MQKTTSKNGRHSEYDLRGDFENIREALAETTEDIKGRAAEILTNSVKKVRNRSIDVQETVADYVADQPFKSIGFAMLAGLILGVFFRRK